MAEEINREIDTIPLHPLQADGSFKFPDSDTVPDWFSQNHRLEIVRTQFIMNSIPGCPWFAVDVWGVGYGKYLAVTPEICGDGMPKLGFNYRSAALTHLPTGRLIAEGPPAEMHSLAMVYLKHANPDDLEDASFTDKKHPPNLRLKAILDAWEKEFKAKVDHQYNILLSSEEMEVLEPSTINFILRKMYEEVTQEMAAIDFEYTVKKCQEKLFEKAASNSAPAKSPKLTTTLDIDADVVQRIKAKLEALHGLINGTATPFSPVLVEEIEFLDKLLTTIGEE